MNVYVCIMCVMYVESIDVYRTHLNGSSSPFGHFHFVLNGQYKMLLDTGSQAAWIKAPAVGNEYACNVSLVYGTDGPNRNSIETNTCAEMRLQSGNVAWKSNLAIANKGVTWWQGDGIVGASMNSDFTRMFPIFTIEPRWGRYDLYVGRFQPDLRCVYLPITPRGIATGKWIVEGRIKGGPVEEFEVDTGFPPIGISRRAWHDAVDIIRHRGGVVTGERIGGYGQVVRNCHSLNRVIPEVNYCFKTNENINACVSVYPKSFATQTTPGVCVVYVLPHDGEYNYVGSALLRDFAIRFDAQRKRIGLCK